VLCRDPIITYLRVFGYSTVRLPKADIRPLQLLAQSGRSLDRLGEVSTVFIPGQVAVPPIASGAPTADINGRRTGDMKIGIGLSILGSVLGAMGGSTLGLDAEYRQAKTAAFEFGGVTEDTIEIAKLDQYLAAAEISPFSRHVSTLLEADELYVTSATIKSKKFSVETKNSRGQSVAVSIPEIQGVVGAEVSVSGQSETTSKVTYEGNVPLVFGFQAIRLFYEEGRYTAFEPLAPAKTALRALEKAPDDGATRFVADGPFARLRDS
jgi:hypothetical protein